jgi:predicted glutamine amidotransferase
MCKVIIIPNASKLVDFDHFARYAAEMLSCMPDGYGFVAQGVKGQFGVRTLSPMGYAQGIDVPAFCESNTESFGEVSPVTGPAMFHGRLSTNTIDLLNTHPITRDGWNLIHNGVVTNHGPKYKMNTSNDSEHVLYNLIQGGINQVGLNLTGYYAGGAIEPNGLLHVFRDSIANLYYTYSEKLESPIFATNLELIEDIGTYIGEELIGIKVKDNTYLIYDGSKLVSHESFTSRGYDNASAMLASKSLGRELSPIEEYQDGISYSELDDDDAPIYREDSGMGYWAKRNIG